MQLVRELAPETLDLSDEQLALLTKAATEYVPDAIESAYIAGLMAGESATVRDLMSTNPSAVLTLASGFRGDASAPVFGIGWAIKELIKWLLKRGSTAAAQKTAKEAAKVAGKRVGEEVAKKGWKGVFKRLLVFGTEIVVYEAVLEIAAVILADPKVDEKKKKKIRNVIKEVEKGELDAETAAERVERIMEGK